MGEHCFNQSSLIQDKNSFRKTIVQTVQVLPDLKLSLDWKCYHQTILKFLDKTPYSVLIVFTIMMLAAPMTPMPHVVEKVLMLTNGTLTRPIDIFDLCFHLLPLMRAITKIHGKNEDNLQDMQGLRQKFPLLSRK